MFSVCFNMQAVTVYVLLHPVALEMGILVMQIQKFNQKHLGFRN